MTRSDIDRLIDWFTTFCASYTRDAGDDDRRNYLLKEVHTHRVREAAVAIATELGCDGADLLLAEAIGLLHDVGRFPQYREYRTFKDADSVNHAARSVRVITEEKHPGRSSCRKSSASSSRAWRSITSTGCRSILDEREDFFLRLIRDADKLDIWRVFLEYYALPEEERASAVGLGFPDHPDCSPEILDAITEGEMINLVNVKTLNDFKLLQLSWIFDLNFGPTRRLFRERGYLAAFAAALPTDEGVRNALSILESYLDRTIGADSAPSCRENPRGYGSPRTDPHRRPHRPPRFLFLLAEFAIISIRKSRVAHLLAEGDERAKLSSNSRRTRTACWPRSRSG